MVRHIRRRFTAAALVCLPALILILSAAPGGCPGACGALLKPGHPEAPCCDQSFGRKLGIKLRVSRRQTLAALRDELRLVRRDHFGEEAKPFEYGFVPELVRVANKEFRVAICRTEIRLQDVDHRSDPATQRRRVEQIEDRPRWIGNIDLGLSSPDCFEPKHGTLVDCAHDKDRAACIHATGARSARRDDKRRAKELLCQPPMRGRAPSTYVAGDE